MIPLEQAISISLLTPLQDPNNKACTWGMPLLIWGSPGIGKSSRVVEASQAAGLPIESIFSAGHLPEDFTGIPVRTDEGTLRRVCALEEVNRLVSRGYGTLFMDELSCAPPTVQAAELKVIMNRQIGSTQLPGKVRIIAAANPEEEAAGGYQLEPPLANRFMHLNHMPPDPEEWTEWLLNGSSGEVLDFSSGETTVKKNWGVEWAKASGLAAGFVRRRGSLLYNLPKEGDAARGKAWPSPRTWEYACRVQATSMCLGVSLEDQMDLVAACVGEPASVEWAAWVQEADLPSPEGMLKHGWTPDGQRLDRNMAAYTAVTSYVGSLTDPADRKAAAIKLWGLLDVCCKAGLADIAGPPAKTLVNHGLSTVGGAELAKAARPVLTRLGDDKISEILSGGA